MHGDVSNNVDDDVSRPALLILPPDNPASSWAESTLYDLSLILITLMTA